LTVIKQGVTIYYMQITETTVDQLINYANNAKIHNDKQVDMLAASIKEFGFNNPILIDDKNTIIAGHGRLMAAKKLNLDKVPTIKLSHLSDAQRKAYILADNRLAEVETSWDMELVSLELKNLQELDFDIDLTGFEIGDIGGVDEAGLTDEDAVPEPPEEPISKMGDVWILGNHRVMCGDSTNGGDVALLMNGEKADMVFTDPPYLIQTEGGCKGSIGKGLSKQGKDIEFISDFNPMDFLELLPTVFSKNYFNAYVFCNKDLLPDYLVWAKDSGISFNPLIWKKPNAIPIGGSHRPDIEFLLLFRKSAKWNGGLKDVNYSRVIECGREAGLHPTMKPVSLIENQMLISSDRNDLIIDFFLGSGSTLIASEKLTRKCYGMELDPKYIDVIIKRWQEYTGKQATHADTGAEFNSMQTKEIHNARA